MAFNKTKILALADKYISQQKHEKALKEYLKIHKHTPGDTNILNKIGDVYARLGNKPNALKFLTGAAENYRKGGFYPKAIALYKKMTRLDPENMDCKERLVELYLKQGHQSEAKAELRRMADLLLGKRQTAKAIGCYEKIIQVDPHNIDVRLKLADLLQREGKRDEAIGHFLAMGSNLIEKKMISEARKVLTQASSISATDRRIKLLLVKAQISEGEIDQAISQLSALCREDDSDLQAIKSLGDVYLTRGQYNEALSCFLRAFRLAPMEHELLEDLGNRLIEEKDLNGAFRALEPVATYYAEQGKVEEAAGLLRSILYVDERHLPAQKKLAEIYLEAKQASGALVALETVINLLMEQGHREEAGTFIRKALEQDPGNIRLREKLQQLSQEEEFARPMAVAPEEVDITSIDIVGDGQVVDLDMSMEGDLEPSDLEANMENHLTEAEVLIKYGMYDQALDHLEKIIRIDPNNLEANNKLKQVFVELGEREKAADCLLRMADVIMDQNNPHVAEEHLNEAEELAPGCTKIHRVRLESMLGIDISVDEEEPEDEEALPSPEFEFDTGEQTPPPGIHATTGSLNFRTLSGEEVLDFSAMAQDAEDELEDVPDITSMSDGADGWSLDIPDSDVEGFDLEAAVQEENPEPDLSFNDQEDDDGPELNFLEDEGDHEHLAVEEMPEESDLEAEFAPPFTEEQHEEDEALEILEDDEELDELPDEDEDEDEAVLVTALPEPRPDDTSEYIMDLSDDSVELNGEGTGAIEDVPEEAEEPAAMLGQTQPAVNYSNETGELLSNELEEIDFFISMEAYDDAENLITAALARFGQEGLLIERLDKVHALRSQKEQSVTHTGPQGDSEGGLLDQDSGFFDLAAELSKEMFDEETEVYDKTSHGEIQSVEELFKEFKKGVDEQIDSDDFETHYDLGIAYKEMGLLSESINEFKKAMGDNSRFLECVTMIGSCLIELGDADQAIQHYEGALANPGRSQGEYLTIKYDLALANEGFGETERALELFREIESVDPNFRDLQEHIAALA